MPKTGWMLLLLLSTALPAQGGAAAHLLRTAGGATIGTLAGVG